MIRLGPIELELVSARGGPEGWSEHWQVYHRAGKRRALIGYAVSPEGAARIAVQRGLVEVQRGKAGRDLRDLGDLVRELRDLLTESARTAPKTGYDEGKETTSP